MKTGGLIALLALALSGNAAAHDEHGGHAHWWHELDPSWYAGAALAQSTFNKWALDDGSFSSRDTDDSDIGTRLFAGVSLGRYLALELGYADFGEASMRAQSDGSGFVWNAGPAAQDVALDGIDFAMVGKLPLTAEWALVGKAGFLKWDSTFEVAGDFQCCGPATFDFGDDGTDSWYGAGVQYDGFAPLRIIGEYRADEFPSVIEDVKVESFGISLAYLWGGGARAAP